MSSIFSGIRILDITKVFSGPFATRMLADYGAEVIKIESIEHPDDAREYPPLKNGSSGYFEILNRNKKGISLNFKNPSDLEKFYQLSKEADVIVENLTPQTKKKLHIDYKTITKHNPKIIYASLSGQGQHTHTKYYDILAQAESGLLSLTGSSEMPVKIGPSVVDAFSGMTLAFAIASSLFFRERTGQGQYLDVSMLGCAMNLLESNLVQTSITKKNPKRTGNVDNLISPFGVYKTRDGYIALAVGNNTQWTELCRFLMTTESFTVSLYSSNALRLRNATRLTELLETAFQKASSAVLLKEFTKRAIPAVKVNQMRDIMEYENLFSQKNLTLFNHTKLGNIVVPGESISFARGKSVGMKQSPSIGQDNKKYNV